MSKRPGLSEDGVMERRVWTPSTNAGGTVISVEASDRATLRLLKERVDCEGHASRW